MYNLEAINNICHKIAKKITEASLLNEEGRGEADRLYEKVFDAIKTVLTNYTSDTISNINELLDL